MKRVLLSWSSGKDCAWALHVLRQQAGVEVVGLLTTINSEFDRVAMHGTRRSVLEAQAEAAQLPLWVVPLPWPCSNEVYEERMAATCMRAIEEGVEAVAFGDLFLRSVREYREKQLKPTGLEPLFPLWGMSTDLLARDMIAAGLRARIVCIDSQQLDASFFRARIRCGAVARSSGWHRPMRRARRIPLLRVVWADVRCTSAVGGGRSRAPGRVRLRRPHGAGVIC